MFPYRDASYLINISIYLLITKFFVTFIHQLSSFNITLICTLYSELSPACEARVRS